MKKGWFNMNGETEIKENIWCVWVNTVEKSVHLKETPNTKKIEFKSEEERDDFIKKNSFLKRKDGVVKMVRINK
jgi:hypothetical protein